MNLRDLFLCNLIYKNSYIPCIAHAGKYLTNIPIHWYFSLVVRQSITSVYDVLSIWTQLFKF